MAIRSLLGHGARVSTSRPFWLVTDTRTPANEPTSRADGPVTARTSSEPTAGGTADAPAGTMAAAVANSNASTDDLPVIGEA